MALELGEILNLNPLSWTVRVPADALLYIKTCGRGLPRAMTGYWTASSVTLTSTDWGLPYALSVFLSMAWTVRVAVPS